MTYKPNFRDPRVRTRCLKAIEWLERYISNRPNFLSTREIDRHLGQQQLPLSKWLRQQLLTCENSTWSIEQHRCKIYRQNSQGLMALKENLGITDPTPAAVTASEREELTSGQFLYQEKSLREYHSLQNIPTPKRQQLLAEYGYIYNYDICCAAPTLITQYARRLGMLVATPALDLYIQDRTLIRNQLAQTYGISQNQAKFLINALLQGARLSHYAEGKIFCELGYNHRLIDQLQQDQYLTQLRQDIKACWHIIGYHVDRQYICDSRGRTRRRPLTGRDKSGVYRSLEQQVMKVVERYIKKNHIKMFKEHDGWRCHHMLDLNELQSYVKSHTGYVIVIDWKKIDIY